ncbi:hypothetical protein WIW50_02815 [Flavobacteriaceae bacterium 3-367]
MTDNFDIQVQRNLQGQRFEKEGKQSEAIQLYEANVAESFEGSFPYSRLAVIYRKQRRYSEEIRILKAVVTLYQDLLQSSPRRDVNPKLIKFLDRLEKAKSKANKVQ